MTAMKDYKVNWGDEQRILSVPRDNLAAELAMAELPPVPDVWQAILNALERPIGSAPLAELLKGKQKIALLTGDRITDVMLGTRDSVGPKLLDYLNRLGVADDQITLVYANGAHAIPDWHERLGSALLGRVKVVRHDPNDESSLKYVGVTSRATPVWINRAVAEADFWLAVGEISPTVHGGWTGGGKIILPGVAGLDTIEQNHFALVKNVNTVGLADGNHMRLDIEEAARLAGPGMKVDVLVDSGARVVAAYAGDFYHEHRAALPSARNIWMTKLDPVDVFVVYPGPAFERYLSGCFWIRLEGADVGLKPGGIIVLAASAAGGWAPEERIRQEMVAPSSIMKLSTEEMARLMLRRQGSVRNISMMYSAKRILERRRAFLVTDGISEAEAKDFGFAHCSRGFDEALSLALAERGKDATIAANIQSSVGWRTLPRREG